MQHIDSDLIRGNIDTIILKTMLNEDKYGLDIIKEVGEKSSGTYELKQPTLYSCLKRLENQELISSYWVDSDIGGRRHYYKLTDKGREFYNKKQEEWAKSKFIIDNLLSNYDYEEYRLVKKDEFDEIIQQKANAPLSNFTQTNFEQSNDVKTEEPADDFSSNDETQKIETTDTLIDEFNSPDIQAEDFKIEMVEDDDEEYGTYYRDQEDAEESDEEIETAEDFENDEFSFENDYQNSNDELPDEYKDMPDFQTIEELEAYLAEKTKSNENDFFNLGEMQNKDFIEEEEVLENLETTEDNDYPVYFSAKPVEEEQKQEETASYETTDQSSNELNFLSRLHSQDDEEINTYYGDQKSYVNHLNQLDESKVEQQDLLDTSLYVKPDLVNKSIDDFYESINKLNNFSSESSSKDTEEFEDEVENNVKEVEETPINFEIQGTNLRPVESQQADFDDLEELEKLKNISSHAFFYSDDKSSYDEINKTKETIAPVAIENTEDNYEPETYNFENLTTQSFEEISNTIEPIFQKEEYDNNLSIDTIDSNETEIETFETSYEENYDCQNNFTDIDSIISNNMATSYPEATQQFFKSQTNVNYREKLSDLSKYSKVTLDEEKTEISNTEAIEKAKDIAEITKELEEEGIRIKEHYKSTSLKGLDKNYLLANKINLMKSLIMFFGYVFVLSALYIVLNNTKMKEMSWFGITPFLIGFIPFAVILIYHAVLFAINPYKKVDAKYHARIMLFISIIITIQLLLITYCVNLQLGFYSFAQKQYNHLLWVIPTIISFAPIIDNLVYLALFKSRNFNV